MGGTWINGQAYFQYISLLNVITDVVMLVLVQVHDAFAFGVAAACIVPTKDWPDNYIFDWERVSVRLRMLI